MWPKREVEVDLFDMDPMTDFSIEADGVFLGNVTTERFWLRAALKLESDDNSHPPGVPPNCLRRPNLTAASVHDASGAFVLEGSFVGFSAGDDDSTVHEEKISLHGSDGHWCFRCRESRAGRLMEPIVRHPGDGPDVR